MRIREVSKFPSGKQFPYKLADIKLISASLTDV